jgi:hypothetical protein
VRTTQFTAQGYELSVRQAPETVQSNIEWNPLVQMPANGAIEVTIALSPPVSDGQGISQVTTAGVLLDGSPDGSRGVLFDVNSTGNWELRRCAKLDSPDLPCLDSEFLATGGDFSFENGPRAPQPGGTTTFHLLLIRQGRTYFLYANGAFLAAYHDDTGPAAPTGMIGFYLDAFSRSARFTDLTVYPTPTGLPFWAR